MSHVLSRGLAVVCLLSVCAPVLSGCGKEPVEDNGPLTFDWSRGQTWHLATSYRLADVHAEHGATSLEGAAEVALGELWSDEVVWTFQVVDTDLKPSPSDELYPYAVTARGKVKDLAVVRAWVDPTLNPPDEALLETDPVVYLVFRQDRSRLAALVAFTNVDGERVEQAFSSTQLSRSWSPLSQSMLTAAPTYLAPHGVRVKNGDRKLENGHWLSTDKVDRRTVDVVYDDEIGGGVVASRYEVGSPWPTWTVAENAEIRLLDKAEVNGLRRRSGGAVPEDYDYRAALSTSVDIDGSLTLSDATLDGEGQSYGAPEGYLPWNGSWWAQSKGALVFGYDERDTLSDRAKADLEPIRKDLDGLSEELRELEDGSSAYDEKLAEYTAKQDELIDGIVAFYDGVLADLDGGTLRIEGSQLVHDEGWSYDLDELSPMDKVALSMYVNGETYPNPFFVPGWELLNHWSPEGGSWWGHCNGWSAAAILNFEPTDDVVAPLGSGTVRYTAADLKGLLSETHYSTYSHFFGARYYGEGDDIADLTPAAFHRLITFYFRDQQVPLVFDTDAGEQVWNFPAYGARVEVVETTEGDLDLVNVNTADADTLDELPGIGETLADRIIEYREDSGPFQSVEELLEVNGIGDATFDKIDDLVTVDPIERTFLVEASVDFATDGVSEDHVDDGDPGRYGFTEVYTYTLVTDESGLVLRGTWDDDEEHPDFAWIPYSNPSTASGSENPYLSQASLDAAVGTDLNRL